MRHYKGVGETDCTIRPYKLDSQIIVSTFEKAMRQEVIFDYSL